MSHCKKWISKPPRWGNVNRSLRAASWAWAHLSSASTDQLGTITLPPVQANIQLHTLVQPQHLLQLVYIWLLRFPSDWSQRPFCLVIMSILIGHGIHSDWSWHLFQLVTAIFLIGHNILLIGHSIHFNWSQCPFWFIRTSFYFVSAHAMAVAKYFAYHPFCP